MSKAVFCICKSKDQANEVVHRLKAAGFSSDDISALLPDRRGTRDFAKEHSTKAPEGAAIGAAAGGVLGGALGWLAGAGVLAVPGIGPLLVAGPLLAALSSAAVGGAVGGVAGALVGLGLPEDAAQRYAGKVKDGSVLLSVHSEDVDEISRAKEILEAAGAVDVASTAEARTP